VALLLLVHAFIVQFLVTDDFANKALRLAGNLVLDTPDAGPAMPLVSRRAS
jgi:hypothetical protein